MKRVYVDLVNEMRSVYRFFNENPDLMTDKPALSTAVESLHSRTTEIQELSRTQAVPTTHETVLKKESHDQMLTCLLKVQAGLMAHAAATNDTRLKMLVDITESKLRKMNESKLMLTARNMLDKALTLQPELLVWNVTPEELTALSDLMNVYTDKTPEIRNLKVRSVQATSEIKNRTEDAIRFLRDTLDPMMAPLKISNSKLYGEYQKARTLVKSSRGHGARKSTETPITVTHTA